MIWNIIIIGFALFWIYLLFKIGQRKDNTFIFFTLIYAQLIIPTFMLIFYLPEILINGLTGLNTWIIIVFIALFGERIVWGITLKEISGNDEMVWFYIAYIFPLFGWLLYRVTKIR